jgi:prevent-host-death family protein
LLRKVRGGATFVVTSHGRPVARIVPVAAGAGLARSARKTLFERLAAAPVVDAGRWTRDELYEDEQS